MVKVRTQAPAGVNSMTDGPYSSLTNRLPFGPVTTPSGSKLRPRTLASVFKSLANNTGERRIQVASGP